MLIEPKDCVITKERFMDLCEKKRKELNLTSWRNAFYTVSTILEAEGYNLPYSSFESFKSRLYEK